MTSQNLAPISVCVCLRVEFVGYREVGEFVFESGECVKEEKNFFSRFERGECALEESSKTKTYGYRTVRLECERSLSY